MPPGRARVRSRNARHRIHLAPGLGAKSPAPDRQLHCACPTGRRDNEQAEIGIARPASRGRRHLSGATQARFGVYRFPWAPSKSAHNRTYEGYTKHEPKITKSRTIGYWKPETASGGSITVAVRTAIRFLSQPRYEARMPYVSDAVCLVYGCRATIAGYERRPACCCRRGGALRVFEGQERVNLDHQAPASQSCNVLIVP